MIHNYIIVCALAVFAISAYGALAHAQNQTQNQSMATVTDKPQTIIANQTTIPAQQTIVIVNQTSEPIGNQSQLQPLQNQTITSQTGNLSNIENKTMIQATGPATTIIANKTTIPFNQTTIDTSNITDSQSQSANQHQPQQLQQQNQTEQTASSQGSNQTGSSDQSQSKQQNQTKGPLEQIGESVNKLIGGG